MSNGGPGATIALSARPRWGVVALPDHAGTGERQPGQAAEGEHGVFDEQAIVEEHLASVALVGEVERDRVHGGQPFDVPGVTVDIALVDDHEHVEVGVIVEAIGFDTGREIRQEVQRTDLCRSSERRRPPRPPTPPRTEAGC